MKNWLDKYSDDIPQAQNGIEGTMAGLTDRGFNSNGAWGGQFQQGGYIPIAQNGWLDKVDNVLSAPARGATYLLTGKYQDPSDALGIDGEKNPYLKLATDIILDPTNLIGVGAISKIGKLAKGVKTVQKTKNVLQPAVKTAFDAATKAGKASGAITWGRNLGKKHKAFFKEYDALLKNLYKPEVVEQALKLGAKDAIGATAIINDLIKQYPEKKEEILKNYKNITKQNTSKNSQQQVIVKNNTAPKYKTIQTGEGADRFEPIQKQPVKGIQNNLQPIGIQSDFNIEADVPQIKPEAIMPKSFDVTSQRQNMSGPSDYYNYNKEGVDFSDAIRVKESADAYNQYIQEKYKEAAKTNPKAQKRLEQLIQNVELTPNYQMGGNIYPVNYVPQEQDGKKLNPFTYPKPDYNYNTNPFLVRDPQHGIFIGGINPTYSTKDFSIGASTVGVGNKDFIEPIVDYGIRGSYNPTDSLSINANLSKNNVGAGISYRFQEGGSLPGASGMMYARQGAPSNGKKTIPSAQGGFSERSQGLTKRDNIKTFKPIQEKDRVLTKAEKEEIKQAELAEKRGDIKKYTPQSTFSKTKEIALNPLTAFGYVARNENLPENFSRSEDTRNILDNAIDFVNPSFYVQSAINVGENQAQVFSDLSQGNFGDAALSQTMAGVEALNFIPIAKQAKKFAKNIPQIKTFKENLNYNNNINRYL
jgi:hypothetical protein